MAVDPRWLSPTMADGTHVRELKRDVDALKESYQFRQKMTKISRKSEI